jgi:hypothetical protein
MFMRVGKWTTSFVTMMVMTNRFVRMLVMVMTMVVGMVVMGIVVMVVRVVMRTVMRMVMTMVVVVAMSKRAASLVAMVVRFRIVGVFMFVMLVVWRCLVVFTVFVGKGATWFVSGFVCTVRRSVIGFIMGVCIRATSTICLTAVLVCQCHRQQ